MGSNNANAYSDDAGGGLRGGRPVYHEALNAVLTREYGFGCDTSFIDIGGSSNLNLRADSAGERYLVRIYRRHTSAERLSDIQKVKMILKENGLPCAPPLKTVRRNDWIEWNGSLVEVEPYIMHDGVMDSIDRIIRALPLMGKMTSALSGVENIGFCGKTPLFANNLQIERALEMTMRGCKRILTWSPSQYECELAEKSIRLAKKINAEGLPAFLDLPKQLSHGDFWDNNVLFYNDEIALIADFDFMGERRRIEDIALTLYFYAYFLTHTHVDAATPESLAAKLKAALDIYDSGLDMPLMAEERHCFPIALALQPLWGIGGWVVLLDDEEAARHHVSDMMWHINFGNQIMDNLLDWQYIFSG